MAGYNSQPIDFIAGLRTAPLLQSLWSSSVRSGPTGRHRGARLDADYRHQRSGNGRGVNPWLLLGACRGGPIVWDGFCFGWDSDTIGKFSSLAAENGFDYWHRSNSAGEELPRYQGH